MLLFFCSVLLFCLFDHIRVEYGIRVESVLASYFTETLAWQSLV